MNEVLLKDFRPECLLKVAQHVPEQAKFPVIDAHNHLFGEAPADKLVEIMDAVGVQTWVNVTGNTTMPLENNTYTIARRELTCFMDAYVERYPGRFAAMTMADFAQWGDPILLKDDDFAKRCIDRLDADVADGACGLKVTKELGLYFRDRNENLLAIDDERLAPIWDHAGELGIPVLMHVSDPMAFFLPIDERNEHYLTLREFPGWSFVGSEPGKWELLEQAQPDDRPPPEYHLPAAACGQLAGTARHGQPASGRARERGDRLLGAHRRAGPSAVHGARFLCALPGSNPVRLGYARFGRAYRCYFRLLETRDEYFDYPDYIGRFGVYTRWKLCALDLPDDVLKKIYRENALRIIPGLSPRLP